MNNLLFSVLVFLLFHFQLSAQSQEAKSDELNISSLLIHVRPSSLMARNPRVGIAIEYQTFGRVVFSFDYGFANDRLLQALDFTERGSNYEYVEFRPEIKYFLSKKKKIYFATEFFLAKFQKTKYDDYIIGIGFDEGVQYDSAVYKKSKRGVHGKFGLKARSGPLVDFDIFVGIGFVSRSSSFEDINSPIVIDLPPEIFAQFERRENFGLNGHATIGLKIGFGIIQKYKSP